MHTRDTLLKNLRDLGVQPDDRLMVHSSMKAIGAVEGGADTVLDALTDAVEQGLLMLPTHTWETVNDKRPVYHPATEPSCVGLLTNLFRKRPGVTRSLHPTHSVAALGKDAGDYVCGEEQSDSPAPRSGCWGKLYDFQAKVLFLGCSTKRNTFLHSVEEWHRIPDRLTDDHLTMFLVTPDGVLERPMRRHKSSAGDVSQNYDKMLPAFLAHGIAVEGTVGDATCYLCDAVAMADLVSDYLKRNPALFADDAPLPVEWYQ